MSNLGSEFQQTVYITGHTNPDTDSICSAIAYAEFKKHFNISAVPVRIGKISRETKFILDYFGFPEPDYLATLKTQVSDLEMDIISPVLPAISLKQAWKILSDNHLEVLPVEDEKGIFSGVVTVTDIARAYMNMPESNAIFANRTPLENIMQTLDARLVCCFEDNLEGNGKVIIAAMTPDGIDEYIEKGDVVFVGNILVNQLKAIDAGARCVILTCGSEVDKDIVGFAQERKCTILVTRYDTFTAARLLYQSIPIESTMTSGNVVTFNNDDFLDDVRDKMLQTRYRSYPVIDANRRFVGFISRFHLLNQRKKKVILVDHSEKSQSVNGLEQAEILEIIDHHRIGDVQTSSPIYYRNEPCGSTATIVANLYSEQGIKPSPEVAGILCAAILSDTIKFKSPTSTQADRITAERLARLAGIEIDAFSEQMFAASASLKNLTTEEIVQNDFKEYAIGRFKVGIGQVNTTDLDSLRKLRSPILSYLNGLMPRNGYHALLILFTDINDEKTEVLFVESQKGLVAKAFFPLRDENSFSMNGVVSRKKQIVPKLVSALS